MRLEQQLAALAELGLRLREEVTIDDLLYSNDRASYEAEPFDLLVWVLGVEIEREPWGRPFSDDAWNFDTECITGSGDYVRIVRNLCRIAGFTAITDLEDHVDLESGEAALSYVCDGKKRDWIVEVCDDWADRMTVSYVIDDIESAGHRFYYRDNGQAMLLSYLAEKTATDFTALTGIAIEPVNPR